MANSAFFQEEFDRLATNGAIGDPHGVPGYAYIRVSSSAQAEEGRSGLPRQIARVHEAAAKGGIHIAWDMVFADDHTGFQFTDRPELGRLRAEYTRPGRRANVVVIEYLDRLSRNADWHQGFLLDEMQQHKVQALFWKGFSSRIERAVMGAISQDGMERSIEIMHEGTLDKARSGRVTCKVPAYGYMFVDADGNPSPKARKETYYAPHPEQADIVKLIFHKVGVEGMSSRALCRYLEGRFPPPGRYSYWQPNQICLFIRNTVYKGEFYANRVQVATLPALRQRPGEPVRMTQRNVERPREEWILVPVPPLVSKELWDAANAMLAKHWQMAKRNGKAQFLLTGLLKCAECGYSYSGKTKNYRSVVDPSKVTVNRNYVCHSRSGIAWHETKDINCTQGQIIASALEEAVWQAVSQLVLQPERLLEQMDARLEADSNTGLHRQMAFLRRQLADSEQEDQKLYRAFMADVFDEEEYAARRKLLKAKIATLEKERKELEKKVVSVEEVEADKALILAFASQAQAMGLMADAPFDFKQRVLKLLVHRITVNVRERWFRIEGHISGLWSIDGPGADNNPPPQGPSDGPVTPSDGAIANSSRCSAPAPAGNHKDAARAAQRRCAAFPLGHSDNNRSDHPGR